MHKSPARNYTTENRTLKNFHFVSVIQHFKTIKSFEKKVYTDCIVLGVLNEA